jgi:hypothetical protein
MRRRLAVHEMITGLAFSRDRALQLEAMLNSFFLQATDTSMVRMSVLYRVSSARHKSQYDQLERQFQDRVEFVRETSFQRQVLAILDPGSQAHIVSGRDRVSKVFHRRGSTTVEPRLTAEDCALFLVDDSLFIRNFSVSAAARALASSVDAAGFSLRLGSNTIRSYPPDRLQSVPELRRIDDGFLKFNWTQADGDFGYPLELSSSLYISPTMVQLLKHIEFDNPNVLESKLSLLAPRLTRTLPMLLCHEHSVAFSAPLNRVQRVYENRAGTSSELSTESLAALFEQGQRINVRTLDGFSPSACHQEVELAFERRDG